MLLRLLALPRSRQFGLISAVAAAAVGWWRADRQLAAEQAAAEAQADYLLMLEERLGGIEERVFLQDHQPAQAEAKEPSGAEEIPPEG